MKWNTDADVDLRIASGLLDMTSKEIERALDELPWKEQWQLVGKWEAVPAKQLAADYGRTTSWVYAIRKKATQHFVEVVGSTPSERAERVKQRQLRDATHHIALAIYRLDDWRGVRPTCPRCKGQRWRISDQSVGAFNHIRSATQGRTWMECTAGCRGVRSPTFAERALMAEGRLA